MSDSTARLALPFLAAGQAQKEIVHNEALVRLDALVQPVVVAVAVNDPPSAPTVGQCWVVGAAPTGAWQGQAQAIAIWCEDGWRIVPPLDGMALWSIADRLWARFDGAAWTLGELAVARILVGGHQVLAGQQPAIADPSGGAVTDGEARGAIAAILAALRTHGLIAA